VIDTSVRRGTDRVGIDIHYGHKYNGGKCYLQRTGNNENMKARQLGEKIEDAN